MFTVVSSLLVFSFGLPEVNRIKLNFLCGTKGLDVSLKSAQTLNRLK